MELFGLAGEVTLHIWIMCICLFLSQILFFTLICVFSAAGVLKKVNTPRSNTRSVYLFSLLVFRGWRGWEAETEPAQRSSIYFYQLHFLSPLHVFWASLVILGGKEGDVRAVQPDLWQSATNFRKLAWFRLSDYWLPTKSQMQSVASCKCWAVAFFQLWLFFGT